MAERRDGVQVLSRAALLLRELVDGSRGSHADRSRRPRGAAALDVLPHRRGALPGGAHAPRALRQAAHRGRPHRHRRGRPPRAPPRGGVRSSRSLSLELHETVELVVLDGDEALFTDQYVPQRSLRVVAEVGDRFPLHCTCVRQGAPGGVAAGGGRAAHPEAELEPLTRFTNVGPRALCSTSSTSCAPPASPTTTRSTRSASRRWARPCVTPAGSMAAITVAMPAARLEGREERIAEGCCAHAGSDPERHQGRVSLCAPANAAGVLTPPSRGGVAYPRYGILFRDADRSSIR